MNKEDKKSEIRNPKSEEEAEKNNELAELQVQVDEEKGRRLGVMADFENYKRRVEAERATFGAIANVGLIQELLEVYDDLQMAMDDQDLDLDQAKISIKTAQDKLAGATARAGVERVEVKIGDEFNKDIMEAVQAVPDEKNKNKVIAVISSAYRYVGQEAVIKHAKVIVGK